MVATKEASVALARDGEGRPQLSATFVVSRAPAPDDRLGDLVEHVTLSAELIAQSPAGLPERVTLEVLGHPDSRYEVDGPFGRGGLSLNLSGREAADLLRSIVSGDGGPVLRAVVHLDGCDAEVDVRLGELFGAELEDAAAWLRIVTLGPFGSSDVPLVRRPRAGASKLKNLVLLQGKQPVPMELAVRPQVHQPVPFIPMRPHLVDRIQLQGILFLRPRPDTSGPVLADAPLLVDRADSSKRWYVPTWVFETPPRGAAPESAAFSFGVVTDGHTSDGREAIVATIRIRLRETMPPEAEQAVAGLGADKVRPVPLEDLRVSLGVPFRDPGSEERIQYHPAESVARSDGALVATFKLRDQWARMAYGSLSTAGFQSRPAHLVASASYRGWRSESRKEVVGGRKSVGLRGAGGDVRGPLTIKLASSRLKVLGGHVLLDPSVIAPLREPHYVAVQATATLPAVDVFVDCGVSGDLYRRARDGAEVAIGCQSAFSLGQGESRTHELVEVAAADGFATVYRSLTRPKRFLLVPRNHCVGRYGADMGERAFRPTLLLHSTIDVERPENLRCILSAGLEPDLPLHVRAAIAQELETAEGGPVQLELPWQGGLSPELTWALPPQFQVEAIPTDTGFAVMLGTDVPGFLTLQNLLRTSGVSGLARYTLPDGSEVTASLRLGLDRIAGPWDTGVVEVTGEGLERQLRNRLTRRVAVGELRSGGEVLARVGRVLAAGEVIQVPVSRDADDLVVEQTVEPGLETLEELRAYIEDLQLAIDLVAAEAVPAGTSVEVRVRIVGGESRSVTLNASRRQAEVLFTLPLTQYLAKPQLEVVATTTGSEPKTFTWSVRDQGVLIPIPV